jgi:hypothetical protein
VPDTDLIARAPGFPGPAYEMEMQRRLKVAITELTSELVSFRMASDAAASRLERLTRWLVRFTVALTVLTVAVVVLTAVLLTRDPRLQEEGRRSGRQEGLAGLSRLRSILTGHRR